MQLYHLGRIIWGQVILGMSFGGMSVNLMYTASVVDAKLAEIKSFLVSESDLSYFQFMRQIIEIQANWEPLKLQQERKVLIMM